MQNILLVRLTSMGDIIHNFPAVTDLAAHYPHAKIDWLVEESFADLPNLHPAIHKVIICRERQWRKKLLSKTTWQEIRTCYKHLQKTPYDLVIDSQGLIKSAILSRLSKRPIAGYDRYTAKEALASYFYTYNYHVPAKIDAIRRNRLLTGFACGYLPDSSLDYGLPQLTKTIDWLPQKPYVVFLTASSRQDKQWALENWINLGLKLYQEGIEHFILPWGNAKERLYCEKLTRYFPAMITPKLSLHDAAVMLQQAKFVIGVDTGLTHLAAAVNTPVISLFSASNPTLTGVQGAGYAANLGQYNKPPAVDMVLEAIKEIEKLN